MPEAPILILLIAVAVDAMIGEPPNALHPVVWIGRAAKLAERVAPSQGPVRQLPWSLAVVIIIPGGAAFATYVALTALPPILAIIASALILKATFAVRALGAAARVVRDAVAAGDLAAARRGLGSLCSRDPADLDGRSLLAATIESVAENASDSIVAPLCWYAIGGLPAAVAYRAINTLDAMYGYRGRFEYLGKVIARVDDLANLVPARLTTIAILLAGAVLGGDLRRGLAILVRDGATTASPNAGRPMAAMAGLLGVVLDKPGCYRLGDPVTTVAPATVDRAWSIVVGATALTVLATTLVLMTHA